MKTDFRKLLQQLDLAFKGVQLAATVVLPLVEAYLINKWTSAADNSEAATGLKLAVLAVAALHLFIAGVLLVSPATPTVALIDLEDKEAALLETNNNLKGVTRQRDRYFVSFRAQQQTDEVLEGLFEKHGSKKLPKEAVLAALSQVLRPYISKRAAILDFTEGTSLYNFAVYMHNSTTTSLNVFYRENDPRIQNPRNRSWEVGCGHVGICFAQKSLIITGDLASSPELFQGGNTKDAERYRSAVSVPFFRFGKPLGVLVITSSSPMQFNREEHGAIFEMLGQNLTRFFTLLEVDWSGS